MVMKNTILKQILILFILIAWNINFTQAARFPNAIEKTFVLEGNGTIELANLLLIQTKKNQEVVIELGRSDSWAVYLLKQDAKDVLNNSDNRMPLRENILKFTFSENPKVEIGKYWLDQGSSLPNPRPNVYSFSTDWLKIDDSIQCKNDKQMSCDIKTKLVQSLLELEEVSSRPMITREKKINFSNNKKFVVQLLKNQEHEYLVRFELSI